MISVQEILALLREATVLMPMDTAERGDWMNRAMAQLEALEEGK